VNGVRSIGALDGSRLGIYQAMTGLQRESGLCCPVGCLIERIGRSIVSALGEGLVR
jgi:hypothetical protein